MLSPSFFIPFPFPLQLRTIKAEGRGRSDNCGKGLQFSLILDVMCLENLKCLALLSPVIMVLSKNS